MLQDLTYFFYPNYTILKWCLSDWMCLSVERFPQTYLIWNHYPGGRNNGVNYRNVTDNKNIQFTNKGQQ